MERSTCGLRGHAGPDGVNASTFHIGGELQPFHGFDPTHVVAATIHGSDVNTLVGPQRTTIVCVICIPEAHTLSAAIEMLGFDGAGNRVVGECSWGFPLPDPNPIHFEGRGERRGSIGVTRPIAAHREVQNEMEVPVKRCFSIPGRTVTEPLVEVLLGIQHPVEVPADLVRIPLDGVIVKASDRVTRRVEGTTSLLVVGPSGTVVQRAVYHVHAIDPLHNVDLTSGRPTAVRAVGGQHPKCWPQSLPCCGKLDASFHSAVGELGVAEGSDPGRGVLVVLLTGHNVQPPVFHEQIRGVVRVRLPLVVAPTRDAVLRTIPVLRGPLRQIEGRTVELVRPSQMVVLSKNGGTQRSNNHDSNIRPNLQCGTKRSQTPRTIRPIRRGSDGCLSEFGG